MSKEGFPVAVNSEDGAPVSSQEQIQRRVGEATFIATLLAIRQDEADDRYVRWEAERALIDMGVLSEEGEVSLTSYVEFVVASMASPDLFSALSTRVAKEFAYREGTGEPSHEIAQLKFFTEGKPNTPDWRKIFDKRYPNGYVAHQGTIYPSDHIYYFLVKVDAMYPEILNDVLVYYHKKKEEE